MLAGILFRFGTGVFTSAQARPVLVVAMVLAYLVLGVCIFGIQLVIDHRNQRQQLLKELETLGNTFVPVAAAALWDFQEDALESMVSGIGKQSEVQKATQIRGDEILWLENESNDLAERVLLDKNQAFVNYLNQTCYLGIVETEIH